MGTKPAKITSAYPSRKLDDEPGAGPATRGIQGSTKSFSLPYPAMASQALETAREAARRGVTQISFAFEA
jgi:hypothetical protein